VIGGPTRTRPTLLGVPSGTVREIGISLARIAAIGLVAIGVSAVLALGMQRIWGTTFVSGDLPGVTYTAERCRDLYEYAPNATTCELAAAEHHFTETVTYRGAAGVLGLALGGAYWWVARRRPRRLELLPVGFEATVGTTAFALGALALLGVGVNPLLVPGGHGDGAGASLSGSIVAAAVACWFGAALVRALRDRTDLG
jgi:hypothetical protein